MADDGKADDGLAGSDTFILLPPSEGKAPGGTRRYTPGSGTFRSLAKRRRTVIESFAAQVAAASDTARSKSLGVRGELLDRAVAATEALAAGTARALPARQRYTGVVWDHLDAGTLTAAQASRILVPSALLGITTGTDPVPDYRAKFTVTITGCGRLDRYWRAELTAAVAAHVAGGTVIDLLPNEHAAAIDYELLAEQCDLQRVGFVMPGARAGVGHAAKAAKGRLARVVLDQGADAVAAFAWENWRTVAVSNGVVSVGAPKARPTSTRRAV